MYTRQLLSSGAIGTGVCFKLFCFGALGPLGFKKTHKASKALWDFGFSGVDVIGWPRYRETLWALHFS